MQRSLERLYTIAELEAFIQRAEKIKLYGAGYYLDLFLEGIDSLCKDYKKKIDCIIVSDMRGNRTDIKGIPVIPYSKAVFGPDDLVLLTLGHRYTETIYDLLKDLVRTVVCIDFNMFQKKAYQEVKDSISHFIEHFPEGLSGLNNPVKENQSKAWTCWWQGEEHAPELVKCCWQSQKMNLPPGTEFVVITEENYRDYIELPEYVLQKVEKGSITLTTLSDIIRAALLYKYGGFWLDATLLILKPLPKEILEYSLYTRTLPETQYCTNVVWADWFLYAKSGNKLFQFLEEAFFYYFSVHDSIKYFL